MISMDEIKRVFDQYRDDLVRFARQRVGCPQMASDIVQMSFEAILKQQEVSSVQFLRAYLYRTVSNQCADYFLGLKRARRYGPLILQADVLRLSESSPSPEDVATKLELIERMQSEVNHLPPKARMAFTLVEIQQHSVREAAEMMDLKEMAVYQLINRAYATLAERIQPFITGAKNT